MTNGNHSTTIYAPYHSATTTTTTSGVSSYATSSTIAAYEAIQQEKDPEEKKKKLTELKKTWREISQYTTIIIVSELFLKYAPTFIFSILIYSIIVNPQNAITVLCYLIVFLGLVLFLATLRSFSDEKSLYLAHKQKELLKE